MLHLLPPILGGTLREHYILLFGAAGAVSLVVGSISGWIGAYWGARRASRKAIERAQRDATQLAESRHLALMQSIETMAVEIERISEAQRFATRLLAERPAMPPVREPARREPGIITPH